MSGFSIDQQGDRKKRLHDHIQLIAGVDEDGKASLVRVGNDGSINSAPNSSTTHATFLQGSKAVAAAGTPVPIWAARGQLTNITCVADVGGSLGGTYFDIYDSAGPVRVWFDVGGGNDAPDAPDGGRLLEVDISEDDTISDLSAAIQAVLDADSEFAADDNDPDVEIENTTTGEVADPDEGTAGMTIEVLEPGREASKLVESVEIYARKNKTTANTGNIYVGDQFQQERVLTAGDTFTFVAPSGKKIDLADIYVDAATNADAVTFSALG